MDRNTVVLFLGVVLLGVALILLAFAGRIATRWGSVDLTRKYPARIVVGVLGAVILALGITGLSPWKWPADVPIATIEQPASATIVSRSPIISGTLRNGGAGTHAWLVVNPLGELGWWPQGGPLLPRSDETWSQPVSIGGDPGQRFRVAVVLASDDANLAFAKYLEEGAARNVYPGKPLPPGATVLTSIDVTLDPALAK
jgi:hypothetical protein